MLDLVVNFPAPIIFALILNEIHQKFFKKTIQTISYMPYLSPLWWPAAWLWTSEAGGPVSALVSNITGGESVNLINQKQNFWLIYVFAEYVAGLGGTALLSTCPP